VINETPDDTPVTTPVEPTAIPVLVVLHIPLAEVSVSITLVPTHTADDPLTGAGNGFTVTKAIAEQPVLLPYKIWLQCLLIPR